MKQLNGWWVTDTEFDNGIAHWGPDEWQNHMSEFTTKYFVPDEKRRRVCLDIGANIGQSALGLTKYFNKVHSFEPCIDFFECLNRNIEQASIDNVITHNVGLSDYSGELFFKEKTQRCGTSRMFTTEEVKANHHLKNTDDFILQRVNVRTLDSYEFKYVDLIKIDVEGWEPYVLKGGIKTINDWKPTIVAEWHRTKDKAALDNILLPWGYVKLYQRRSDWYYVHKDKVLSVVTNLIKDHPVASHTAFWRLLGI
jgi:FkbM family methyltransferase